MPEKILQCGYMSGDTFTAAVFLKLNPDATVVLVKDTKEPQDKTDKMIRPFYTECGLGTRVVTEGFDISDSPLEVKDLWKATSESFKTREAPPAAAARVSVRTRTPGARTTVPTPPVPTSTSELNRVRRLLYNQGTRGWPRSITAVTGLVANAYKADPVETGKAIASLWNTTDYTVEMRDALTDYVVAKFGKIHFDCRKNVVVLWSRQSGKRGGAHLELDSSYAGIRDLARYFAKTKGSATVLLAGDESKNGGKLAALAAEHSHIIDVSNMWTDAAWKVEPLKSSPYLGQFTFFKEVAREANVIHIGMRSGMLEAMALLGMTTLYMEPSVCPSGQRMVAFGRNGINYTRVQIRAPASLTSWQAQRAIEDRSAVAPNIDGFNDRLQRTIASLMKYKTFTSYYKTMEDARADAPLYARAELLLGIPQKDLLEFSPIQIKQKLKAERGFYEDDFKLVTSQIESLFAK